MPPHGQRTGTESAETLFRWASPLRERPPAMIQDGIRATGSLLLNRLLSGIWVPMLVATILAVLLALGIGVLDERGLAALIAAFGSPFDFGEQAAENHLDALLSVQVAVLTLYISITLLVLTLAASSLGSRLIERWIARIEIRATLVQWTALVAYSLAGRIFVNPGVPVPRGLVLTDFLLTILALGWLGFGYHRLARTAHIDTSIVGLGRTFGHDRQDWGLTAGPDPDAEPETVLRAWASGYLGGFRRDALIAAARSAGGRMAIRIPDGAYIVEGDPLVHFWGDDGMMQAAFRKTGEIADYRSDRPQGPFSLSLLVEIAARALSPSVNDHETAATCADWIGHGLSTRLRGEAGPEGWFTDDHGEARLHVPECGVIAQSRLYLSVFHRAARPHPFVARRLVSAYSAAYRRAQHAIDRAQLSEMIEEVMTGLAEDATDYERAAVEGAFDAARRGDPPLVSTNLAAE